MFIDIKIRKWASIAEFWEPFYSDVSMSMNCIPILLKLLKTNIFSLKQNAYVTLALMG